jgi:hypothetical protein
MAKDAAFTLKSLIQTEIQSLNFHQKRISISNSTTSGLIPSESSPNIVLYSSKLIRCVQTAYEIALQLNISTITVSTGLALTAKAVEECRQKNIDNGPFIFSSIEEIRAMCPAVEVVDGDPFIPSSSWDCAIRHIAAGTGTCTDIDGTDATTDSAGSDEKKSVLLGSAVPVVVAHRETIRNMIGQYLRLPYCCIARFGEEGEVCHN